MSPEELANLSGWTPNARLCGWRNDGGHYQIGNAIASKFRMPNYADSGEPLLLYKAWHDVLGSEPAYVGQQIGDCVSFGHAHANDLLQCIEISAFGEASEYRETDTEFIYGESRKVAHILSNQDGSYGAAAAKAMLDVGIVSREMLGNQGAYSGKRAKSWGLNGPPSEIEQEANAFRLGSVSRITSWEQLVAAIWNGMPTTVCSNQGFTMTRDDQGFCIPHGQWGHCMFCAGLRFDRPGGLICQSWGPNVPDGPTDLEQPSFSFWVDKEVLVRMLALGDSWALSRAPEFVKRELPHYWRTW